MTSLSNHVLEHFQIRKSKQQKEDFRRWLCHELEQLGYAPQVEQSGKSHNVVVGDPDAAKVICTAHYDTCAVMPLPNFITPRNALWYFLYQLLLCLPMFVVAFGSEILLLKLWEDCPVWLALAVVYAALGFFLWWLTDGPANKHTVNDNTSGVITLLEIAQSLPAELRDQVCLVFFDNEEKGLRGSKAFVKAHKAVKEKSLVLNFDCVSDGDFIQFFPSKTLKKEENVLNLLADSFPAEGEKDVQVVRSFGFYPSDQAQFKRGVGICALKKSPIFGYYMDRIHTKRDTVMMEENITLLRDGTLRLVQTLNG